MNKTTEALKLSEEALNAMLTHMGMDEDEWTKPTFDQARVAITALREALDHIAATGKLMLTIEAAEKMGATGRCSECPKPVQEPVNYLIDALKTAKWMLERDYIDQQKMKVIEQCDDAIEKATGGGND